MWAELLLQIEADLILPRASARLTTGPLPKYLFLRCNGQIDPLMRLISAVAVRLAAKEAKIRGPAPELTVPMLHSIPAPTRWEEHRWAAWQWFRDRVRQQRRAADAEQRVVEASDGTAAAPS
jgi:hypothetical protein